MDAIFSHFSMNGSMDSGCLNMPRPWSETL